MAVDGLLSLRWNNHLSSFLKQLSFLRDKETYSDLTLVCGGQFYQVHRLVVSGCSEYFRAILEHTPCHHPAVVLQDLPPQHLEALLSYMYLGQVSVPQDQLGGLIKAAECLAIKGLAVPDEATPTTPPLQQQECHGHPAPAWEDGLPRPKRRRQDNKEAISASPSARADDLTPEDHKGRRSRGDSRGKSPPPATSTATPQHQHTLVEETAVIKVEDEENEEEVKCEEESNLGWSSRGTRDDIQSNLDLPDSCEGMAGQHEVSHEEEGQAIYDPDPDNSRSVLQRYPSQPQSIEEVVTQAMPGPSGMHREAGQGWECGQGKGSLTAAAATATFPLENFTLQEDAFSPTTHHATLHQRGPGRSGWSRQDPHTLPLFTAQPEDVGTSCSTQPWPAAPNTAGEGTAVVSDRRCCQICGYKGQDVAQLRKHLRIHTGEKPFQCPSCSYSSTQSSNLKVHIKRHHPALGKMNTTAAPRENQQASFLIQ